MRLLASFLLLYAALTTETAAENESAAPAAADDLLVAVDRKPTESREENDADELLHVAKRQAVKRL